MTTALITGAAGFIGPHIVNEFLNRGWSVKGIDIVPCDDFGDIKHTNYSFEQKDVRDLEVDDLLGVDYVVHLAFVTNIPNSITNPLDTTRDNINMTTGLMDIATKAKVKKFLFPSTASQYGNNPIPWNETMTSDPIEPYSWQKLSCEFACKMWFSCYGLPTTIFRFFQVFGENQRKDTAISAFIRSKREGKPITLVETTAQSSFRTGRRDFIYVKDLAEAVAIAAESEKTGEGEILNIGCGEATTMEDVANAIGGKVTFIPRRKFEVEAHLADMSKTKEMLGWEPKVGILDWVQIFSQQAE